MLRLRGTLGATINHDRKSIAWTAEPNYAPTKLANGQYEWLNDLETVEVLQRVADLAGTIPERNASPETKLRRPIRMRNSPSGSIQFRLKNPMASIIFGLN